VTRAKIALQFDWLLKICFDWLS